MSSSPINPARSSKVWPAVQTSELPPPPPTGESGQSEAPRPPTPIPNRAAEFRRLGGHRRRATSGAGADRTLGQRCIKLRKRVGSSCRMLASDFSEVCFVSGIITAFIGSLVAISGIFTRNQARTRLYMEGFGCGMVILGVLVVFLSLKLRASRDLEFNQSSNLFNSRTQNSRFVRHQQQLLMEQQQEQQHPLNSLRGSLANYSPEPVPLVTTSFADQSDAPPSTPFRSSLIDLTTRRRDSEDDSLSLAWSLCAANQGQAWTPCLAPDLSSSSSAYCGGHERATIEAALSIVLAAATIAGFRPASRTGGASQPASAGESPRESGGGDGGGGTGATDKHEHFCCLHHTVQHKLQARKWINCLRIADPQDAIRALEAAANAGPETRETLGL